MRHARFAVLLVSCALVLIAAAATAAGDDSISGPWRGSADSPQGSVPFSLDLKVDGDVVTGTMAGDQGTGPIQDGSWKDGVLSFKTSYNGAPVTMTAKVQDGRLAGEYTYNNGEAVGSWTASRPEK